MQVGKGLSTFVTQCMKALIKNRQFSVTEAGGGGLENLKMFVTPLMDICLRLFIYNPDTALLISIANPLFEFHFSLNDRLFIFLQHQKNLKFVFYIFFLGGVLNIWPKRKPAWLGPPLTTQPEESHFSSGNLPYDQF